MASTTPEEIQLTSIQIEPNTEGNTYNRVFVRVPAINKLFTEIYRAILRQLLKFFIVFCKDAFFVSWFSSTILQKYLVNIGVVYMENYYGRKIKINVRYQKVFRRVLVGYVQGKINCYSMNQLRYIDGIQYKFYKTKKSWDFQSLDIILKDHFHYFLTKDNLDFIGKIPIFLGKIREIKGESVDDYIDFFEKELWVVLKETTFMGDGKPEDLKYNHSNFLLLYHTIANNKNELTDLINNMSSCTNLTKSINSILYYIILFDLITKVEETQMLSVIGYLIEKCDTVSDLNSEGQTLFHVVTKHALKVTSIFNQIISHNSVKNFPNVLNEHGKTALLLFIENPKSFLNNTDDSLKIVSALFKVGININQADVYGYTAILRAVVKGNTKLIELLLNEKNIDIDTYATINQETARNILEKFNISTIAYPIIADYKLQLFHLLYTGKEEEFCELFSKMPNKLEHVNLNNGSMSLLSICAKRNLVRAASCLLKNRADPNDEILGKTPITYSVYLHNANISFRSEMTVLLLSFGAYIYQPFLSRNVLAYLDKHILKEHFDNCLSLCNKKYTINFKSFKKPSHLKFSDEQAESMIFNCIKEKSFEEMHHPVLMCLLLIKCHKIKNYNLFIILLNFLFWLWFLVKILNESKPSWDSLFYIFSILELVKCFMQSVLYKLDFLKDISKVSQFLTVIFVLFAVSFDMYKPIIVILLLIASFNLMRLLGSHPNFFIHTRMVEKVTLNYLKLFSWYLIYITGFTAGFSLLCSPNYEIRNHRSENLTIPLNTTSVPILDKNDSFYNFFNSFYKIFIMITGEFNADDITYYTNPIIFKIYMITFVFLFFFVLCSVLQALAITDIQAIREDVESHAYQARINIIIQTERLLYRIFLITAGENKKKSWLRKFFSRHWNIHKYFETDNSVSIITGQNSKSYLYTSQSNLSFQIDSSVVKHIQDICDSRGLSAMNSSVGYQDMEKAIRDLSNKYEKQIEKSIEIYEKIEKLSSENTFLRNKIQEMNNSIVQSKNALEEENRKILLEIKSILSEKKS